MQTHKLIQGSDAWNQFRLQHHGASEAAAMLGLSLVTKRSELLRMKHTGIAKEFGDWVQKNILDHGHAVEHAALAHVEAIVGDDLYPVTCSDGAISASCDGLTMARDIAFEHKQWNERIAALVTAGEVPPEHMPQCQQVLMVSKAEKLIFVVSDGTPDRMVWVWVYPDRAWFDRLRAGWAQFDADLAAYVLPAASLPVVASPTTALPAVSVQVTGSIAVVDNFAVFEKAAVDFIENRLIRNPETDQDFADLDLQIKSMKNAEDALDAAEAQMLAQVAPVDTAKRTKDMLRKLIRDNRLMSEKLLTTEKERRRGEIVAGGMTALRQHIEALNTRLGKPYMPAVPADFGGAIKGKKNLDSMQDAVDTLLANTKIAANEKADLIQANLTTLRELGGEHKFLFADAGHLVLKANDDLTALVKTRIAEHQRQEEEKEAATRERIRREEEHRAQQQERERQAELQRQADAAERERQATARQEALDTEARAQAGIAEARATAALPEPLLEALSDTAAHVRAEKVSKIDAGQVIASAQRPAAVPAQADVEPGPATLLIGAINAQLEYIVNAAFLSKLGFEPARIDGARRYYLDSDLPRIGRAIAAHSIRVTQLQTA